MSDEEKYDRVMDFVYFGRVAYESAIRNSGTGVGVLINEEHIPWIALSSVVQEYWIDISQDVINAMAEELINKRNRKLFGDITDNFEQ